MGIYHFWRVLDGNTPILINRGLSIRGQHKLASKKWMPGFSFITSPQVNSSSVGGSWMRRMLLAGRRCMWQPSWAAKVWHRRLSGSSQLLKANRPFDLLVFPFWSMQSHSPESLTQKVDLSQDLVLFVDPIIIQPIDAFTQKWSPPQNLIWGQHYLSGRKQPSTWG